MIQCQRSLSRFSFFGIAVTTLFATASLAQSPRASLLSSRYFHASFDGTADAKVTLPNGDGRVFTADTLQRKQMQPGIHRSDVTIAKGDGKFGDCLRFANKSKQVICYSGDAMQFKSENWSGSLSMWMRLNPDKDLQPGYCDPIQITQLAWNNAAFFVDFDKDLPRDFRLGVFSDLSYWNPKNVAWEAWPIDKRPMVTVKAPPFSKEEWTNVIFTFENINAASNQPATATLYMNGQSKGKLTQPMQFHWDMKKVAIMLGIEYIGDLDELMLFDKALDDAEVSYLYRAQESL
jgi:Concanavalin A-like lectin/glucanases superfamily